MIQANLEKIFDWVLYTIVLLPVALIAAGGGMIGGVAAASLVAIAASWFTHKRKLGHQIKQKTWDILVASYVVVTVIIVFVFDFAILDGAIQLLLVLTCVRLFSRLSMREEFQIFILSFILLAAATTIIEDLLYGVVFGLYVLAGTFGLAVFHLRNELMERPRLAFRSPPRLERPYAVVLIGTSGIVLATSLLLFFVFPRVGLGFFAPQSRDGMSMVGFSESVELGGHGLVRDNPQVVLRVEFPEGRPSFSQYHWRMLSFDHYDGRSWTQTLQDERKHPLHWRRPLDDIYPQKGEPKLLQMYMEPLDTALLPTLFPTHSIKLGTPNITMPIGPRSGRLTMDAYSDIRHSVPSNLGIPYMIWVAEPDDSPREKVEAANPAFLQQPIESQRFADLTRQAVSNATQPKEIARNIEEFLESNYTYTTDLPEVGESPVEDFLFTTRRGHCEYFATTATLMLREAGVHARIVNGFYGGQWNNVGDYWAVRQGDAHSWVEYFDPNVGWLKLDPTPPSTMPQANALLDTLRKTMDASRLAWTKWVIEYDLSAQIDVLRSAADTFAPKPSNDRDAKREFNWTIILGSLGVVLVGVGGFALWKRRKTRLDPLQSAFVAIEEAAKRAGLNRRIDEGPSEFLERLASKGPKVSAPLGKFRGLYLGARYGNLDVDINEIQMVSEHIIKYLKSLKKDSL